MFLKLHTSLSYREKSINTAVKGAILNMKAAPGVSLNAPAGLWPSHRLSSILVPNREIDSERVESVKALQVDRIPTV